MANPLFNGMGGGNNFMQNVMQMVQSARGAGNPQMFINQLAQRNPQVATQINELMKNGQSPQNIAMNIMQQRGMDPKEMMNMLGGFGRR